jgi:hypothetical protein
MPRWAIAGAIVIAAALVAPASAELIVDQEQTQFRAASGNHALPIAGIQSLAQSFTVGQTGRLTHIELPIGCVNGTLRIEIRDIGSDGSARPWEDGSEAPTGLLLAESTHPASEFTPAVDAFRRIALDNPIDVRAGQKLAFVLHNSEGLCLTAFPYGASDWGAYSGGKGWAFWRGRSPLLPPGVRPDFAPCMMRWCGHIQYWYVDGYAAFWDLAFRTIVDVPPEPDCLPGGGRIGDRYLPACRCIADGGLRQFRCAILHPDFFMVRRWPCPPPGDGWQGPREEVWEFAPMTRLGAPVRVTFYGGGLEKPLTHEFGSKKYAGELNFGERFAFEAKDGKNAAPGAAIVEYFRKDAPQGMPQKFEIMRRVDPEVCRAQ